MKEILPASVRIEVQMAVLALGLLLPLGAAFFSPLVKELLKDLRMPRILHYVALAGFGYAVAYDTGCCLCDPPVWADALQMGLYALALAYAAVFAIVTNNLEDVEADRLTNPSRPTVRGTVERGPYARAGWTALGISLVVAVAAGTGPLVGVVGASLGYYLYSCRPFRLKRIPFLSKFIIGCNSMLVALGGFILRDDLPLSFFIPAGIFILLPLSLAANFIDLKDTEGDRATGISTLPVMFGERKARNMIAAFTLASYATSCLFIGRWYLYAAVAVVAAVHLWLLYRKPYNEKPIFLVYVGGLLALDVILLLIDHLP
jgi:4-hydroxybenzoate polyprenyltransferase